MPFPFADSVYQIFLLTMEMFLSSTYIIKLLNDLLEWYIEELQICRIVEHTNEETMINRTCTNGMKNCPSFEHKKTFLTHFGVCLRAHGHKLISIREANSRRYPHYLTMTIQQLFPYWGGWCTALPPTYKKWTDQETLI